MIKEEVDKTSSPESATTIAQKALYEILQFGIPTFQGHRGYDLYCFFKEENDFWKVGRVILSTLEDCSNILVVNELELSCQGKGYGRLIMELICGIANKNQVVLKLDAAIRNDSLMTQDELVNWYKKFGFIPEGGNDLNKLIRSPA